MVDTNNQSPTFFSISCSFLDNFGKIVGWCPPPRGNPGYALHVVYVDTVETKKSKHVMYGQYKAHPHISDHNCVNIKPIFNLNKVLEN